MGASVRRWGGWRHVSTIVLLLVLAFGVSAAPAAGQAAPDAASEGFGAALRTQAATRAHLAVLGDAFVCSDARLVSYRLSDVEPETVAQWYVASQLLADADLIASLRTTPAPPTWDPTEASCYLDKGFIFLDRLWDFAADGYFSRSDPTGSHVTDDVRFGDDNALAGLALLAAARVSTEPQTAERYLHDARRQADFLIGGPLWDTTFGGGFWWNSTRGATAEGKPAQTNALAALFFARLYDATGDATYADWSRRTLLWLDTILYDTDRHLYRWSVAYAQPDARTGSVRAARYFDYDQGLAIEAQLELAAWDHDPARVRRAEDIAGALQTTFWTPDLGGYTLEAGVPVVYTAYGAWTSLGQLALYDADHDSTWLGQAQANARALETVFGQADGGFGYRDYRCPDTHTAGCETSRNGVAVDDRRDTAAQAWAQQLQQGLAQRAAPTPTPGQPSATPGLDAPTPGATVSAL